MAVRVFAPAADVGGEAKLLQRAAHFLKVVAFIQTHTLGMLWTGLRAWHGETVHRGPYQLQGWPRPPPDPPECPASVNRLRLTPFLRQWGLDILVNNAGSGARYRSKCRRHLRSGLGRGGLRPMNVQRQYLGSRWWGWSEWPGRRGVVGAVWILLISSFPKFSRSSAIPQLMRVRRL